MKRRAQRSLCIPHYEKGLEGRIHFICPSFLYFIRFTPSLSAFYSRRSCQALCALWKIFTATQGEVVLRLENITVDGLIKRGAELEKLDTNMHPSIIRSA